MDKFKNKVGGVEKQAQIQDLTIVDLGGGASSKTWATVATISVIFLPANAQEIKKYDQLQSIVTHKIYTLFADYGTINSTQRVIFDGRVFNVHPPLNLAEGDSWIKTMLLEGVAT